MNTVIFDEFLVLAQYASFYEAAESLGISQSALSKHIAKLEKELGVRLLTRETPITMTAAGRVLFEGLQLLKRDFTKVVCDCQLAASEPTGELRIQNYPFDQAIRLMLLRASDVFIYQYPSIRINTVDVEGVSEFEAIDQGYLDIAYYLDFGSVMDTKKELSEMGFGSIPKMVEFNTIALRKDHPLASEDIIRLEDLANVPIMFYSSGISANSFGIAIEKMCQEAGFTTLFNKRSATNAAEFLMLDPGKSVYLVTNSMVMDYLKIRPSMVIKSLDCSVLKNRFWTYFIYKDNPSNPYLAKFLKILKEQSSLTSGVEPIG